MGGKRTKISDNLYQEVYPNGTTYFLFRATIDGKRVSKALGKKGEIGIREAKARAAELLVEMRGKAQSAASPTFKTVYLQAIDDIGEVRQWGAPRLKPHWVRSMEMYAVPALGEIEVGRVTRDDVLSVLDPIWKTKTRMAVTVMQRLESIFNWCVVRGYRDAQNPAVWRGNLELFLPPPSKVSETEHHAAPTVEDLKSVVSSLRERDSMAAGAILLIIASACRCGEARMAREDEFVGDVWTIPAKRMKVKSAGDHRVPITPLVRLALEKAKIENGFVFVGRSGEKGVGESVLRRAFYSLLPGRNVTLHGIRSTFRDWAAENGVPDAVAEKCLAHTWGNAVTTAYYRSDLLEQRREVMERWSEVLMGKKIPHT